MLAAAGLDVIVVESGDYYDDRDFDGSELTALTQFYMGAPAASHDQSVTLLAGSCLGGGTVVNYSTSFRTPDELRSEWASHGVSAFASGEYTTSLDAVCERLGVNQEHNEPSSREQKLQEGCVKLGWQSTRCRAACAIASRARNAVLRAGLPGRREAIRGQDVARRRPP